MPDKLNSSLSEKELQFKIISLVGIWAEALLYGLYFSLFVAALPVFVRGDVLRTFPAKVFLAGNTLMFLLISTHTGLEAYQLIVAFSYQINPRAPVAFLCDLSNGPVFAAPVFLAMTIWIGDALVIFRLFLIWRRSYWVVTVPALLFVSSVAIHSTNLWWVQQQSHISDVVGQAWPLLNAHFPLYVSQNILTTGLILFKIWSRYRQTKAIGIFALHTPNLLSVMRVIIESAALHTAALLVMLVLRILGNPSHFYLVHCIVPPTIGIVFVLMTIRTHALREEARIVPESASLMPNWLMEREGRLELGMERGRRADLSTPSAHRLAPPL
ncbi:hypothetical protein BKA70DRAFT_128904 [Coprinopsis sp. MPI-PUGE-AT-0042]|nr:hypothetical protein BKA70DRAFT_128904 [Coprinopsis sp. MPI-PUGE-AT-0042]